MRPEHKLYASIVMKFMAYASMFTEGASRLRAEPTHSHAICVLLLAARSLEGEKHGKPVTSRDPEQKTNHAPFKLG